MKLVGGSYSVIPPYRSITSQELSSILGLSAIFEAITPPMTKPPSTEATVMATTMARREAKKVLKNEFTSHLQG